MNSFSDLRNARKLRNQGAGDLSLIKNKEAITFFLLNENAPNFGRAEGMGRK